jgi:hypothetical protein
MGVPSVIVARRVHKFLSRQRVVDGPQVESLAQDVARGGTSRSSFAPNCIAEGCVRLVEFPAFQNR